MFPINTGTQTNDIISIMYFMTVTLVLMGHLISLQKSEINHETSHPWSGVIPTPRPGVTLTQPPWSPQALYCIPEYPDFSSYYCQWGFPCILTFFLYDVVMFIGHSFEPKKKVFTFRIKKIFFLDLITLLRTKRYHMEYYEPMPIDFWHLRRRSSSLL